MYSAVDICHNPLTQGPIPTLFKPPLTTNTPYRCIAGIPCPIHHEKLPSSSAQRNYAHLGFSQVGTTSKCSCSAQFLQASCYYRILSEIRAELNNVRFKKNRGYAMYRLNVISLRVTLNLKLTQGPNRGMRYKPEERVSLREYGNTCAS